MAPNTSIEASGGTKLVGRLGVSELDRPVHQGMSLWHVGIWNTDKGRWHLQNAHL